jgi:type VI secretion system protein VasG
MIDAIVTNTMLPALSTEVLSRQISGTPLGRLAVDVDGPEFTYAFD